MARVASNPLAFPRELIPRRHPSSLQRFPTTPPRLLRTSRPGPQVLSCRASPDPADPLAEPPVPPPPPPASEIVEEPKSSDQINTKAPASVSQIPDLEVLLPNRSINRRIALASSFAAVGFFLSRRLEFGVSLKDLSAAAIPYEQALANGMPTVVEFYADWCEVCRELAPDVYKVEQQYKDRVNFVMLNVDNTKWEQELDEFGVEGIPHFAFLDKDGNEEGNVVGRLPKQYLLDNVAALANGEPSIPHARVVGQYSNADSRKVHQVSDPRSHG